ncbi:transporter [Vibrio metoecus]|nr:transporter [Vibrio metoecus]PAR32130.1 transporter [Vibrio metoecus]PAR38284.1 transporter [Vibrio metoecus]PAR45714.1 transporter [Vibrio metoecus]PAR51318.1 transporter [Vibrio metoecus]
MVNSGFTVLPIMSGDRMEKVRISAVFDYTTFLGASCTKKWTFVEAVSSFAPIFGIAWLDAIKEEQSPQDRLWDVALKRLSTRRSDESNLITLVKLAKQEGIEELTLVMPYALDEQQLTAIQSKSAAQIESTNQDEFLIKL